MKRILVVLTVALVMVAMMAATAGPALAQGWSGFGECKKDQAQGFEIDCTTPSGPPPS